MNKPQPKTFNTTGVCIPAEHYMLPVLPRIPDIGDMIEGKFYFVLHAPRQSGKTTFLDCMTDQINSSKNYYPLNCDLSPLRSIADEKEAIEMIVDQL
jgi:predicted AAA+ superfamily ATPase